MKKVYVVRFESVYGDVVVLEVNEENFDEVVAMSGVCVEDVVRAEKFVNAYEWVKENAESAYVYWERMGVRVVKVAVGGRKVVNKDKKVVFWEKCENVEEKVSVVVREKVEGMKDVEYKRYLCYERRSGEKIVVVEEKRMYGRSLLSFMRDCRWIFEERREGKEEKVRRVIWNEWKFFDVRVLKVEDAKVSVKEEVCVKEGGGVKEEVCVKEKGGVKEEVCVKEKDLLRRMREYIRKYEGDESKKEKVEKIRECVRKLEEIIRKKGGEVVDKIVCERKKEAAKEVAGLVKREIGSSQLYVDFSVLSENDKGLAEVRRVRRKRRYIA